MIAPPETKRTRVPVGNDGAEESIPGVLPKPFERVVLTEDDEPPSTLPPIDAAAFAVIGNLEALGAKDVVQQVLSTYLREAPALLAEIDASLSVVSAERLSRAAHSLKSCSGNVGALVLSSLCAQAEALGRGGTCVGALAVATSLRSEFARVRQALEIELAARSKGLHGSGDTR